MKSRYMQPECDDVVYYWSKANDMLSPDRLGFGSTYNGIEKMYQRIE